MYMYCIFFSINFISFNNGKFKNNNGKIKKIVRNMQESNFENLHTVIL